MLDKGIWTGHYDHGERTMRFVSGLTSTKCTIEITGIINNYFTGTVQDDLSTGGTEGIGKIEGKVSSNTIDFIKRMPVMTLIVDKDGTRKILKRKHRPIYYSGTFSPDKKTVNGDWHFKAGILWVGYFPRFIRRQSGTWTMSSDR